MVCHWESRYLISVRFLEVLGSQCAKMTATRFEAQAIVRNESALPQISRRLLRNIMRKDNRAFLCFVAISFPFVAERGPLILIERVQYTTRELQLELK